MALIDYSTKRALWPTQETISEWIGTATNSAGWLDIAAAGDIMCGATARNATLIWTTRGMWAMTYIGEPLYYRAERVGDNCGIIGVHAAVVLDAAAYWMGTNGFFAFDGFARPISCDVYDYVFGSLNRSYAFRIWAYANTPYNEITWHYPSASAVVCDRYVTYNYIENHWVIGTLDRACGVSAAQGGTSPILFNSSGEMFDHETALARNSEGTPSLESGPLELEDGDNLVQIQKIIPDDETVGDVNLTIYGAQNPDSAETTYGPYTLTASTSVRVKARQARLKLTEAVANAWRVGVIRLGVVKSSRR